MRHVFAAILLLTILAFAGHLEAETVSFDLSGAYNYDLLGNEVEYWEAVAWGAANPAGDYALADVFGQHRSMMNVNNMSCYYVNDDLGLPAGGRIATPYAAYQLGPASVADVKTHQPSPNAVTFGKPLDGTAKVAAVSLPVSQRKHYQDVNFLLVHWYALTRNNATANRNIRLWADYDTGAPGLLYAGPVPDWKDARQTVFRAAVQCSTFVDALDETPRRVTLCQDGTSRDLWEFAQPLPADASRTLRGFHFEVQETQADVEDYAVVFAGAGRVVEGPIVQVTLTDNLNWVYQNSPAMLANGGHALLLTVGVLDLRGNHSFDVQVNKVADSGPGEIIVNATADPLVKRLVGSQRNGQGAAVGALTLEVVVKGDVSTATAQLAFSVRTLGDIDGDGLVTGADRVLLNRRLDLQDAAGLPEQAFDLDAAGGLTTDDRGLLIQILNGVQIP